MTTKAKAKHTPLPWKVEIVPIPSETAECGRNRPRYGLILAPDGVCIAETCFKQREANARLIVRAVNSHKALVEACRAAHQALMPLAQEPHPLVENALDKLDAALALAKEGEE